MLWKPPVYTTVSNLLTNPVYAGAYAFGRTGSRTIIENGRKRIVRGRRKARSDWAVLLVDHHEGYLSWADFQRNQRLITDNANGKGMMVRGPVRKGEALLARLLRCGHCGRRQLVGYSGAKGDVGRYKCDATRSNPDGDSCISFGALRVDEAVGAEIVRLLQRSALKRPSRRSPARAKNSPRSSWRSNRRDMRQSERAGEIVPSRPYAHSDSGRPL
ncbi:recombinase family protein [Mesorhizobium sp.]|uniref:recombinase family protein n=1 Tax=Mesorhizobium sp. TaxID=1871066 RepID=UPI0025F6779E|nr:recombinase family protein [Mesorhizobium sp.]